MKEEFHEFLLENFHGISLEDFKDFQDSENLSSHRKEARDIVENPTYIGLWKYLIYRQERYIVNTAKNEDELIWGRAVLKALDLIDKALNNLALQQDQEEQYASEDSPLP